MNMKDVRLNPYEKSISPGMRFDIRITHTKYEEAIINVNGQVQTGDEKMIATINGDTSETPTKTSGEVALCGRRQIGNILLLRSKKNLIIK